MSVRTLFKALFVFCVVVGLATVVLKSRRSAPADADADIRYFQLHSSDIVLHFRARSWSQIEGRQDRTDGAIERGKRYHQSQPITFDFFVQPGSERLVVSQLSDGRRAALYFRNLRVVDDHAEADVVGRARNFLFASAPNGAISTNFAVRRHGTMTAPQPHVFKIGSPVSFWPETFFSYENITDPGYRVSTSVGEEVELIAAIPLSKLLETDNSLIDQIAPEVQKQAQLDIDLPVVTIRQEQ